MYVIYVFDPYVKILNSRHFFGNMKYFSAQTDGMVKLLIIKEALSTVLTII